MVLAGLIATVPVGGRGQAEPVALPLDRSEGWSDWGYRGRSRHEISRASGGLQVRVDRSAGGLAYRLPAPAVVRRVQARGRVSGALAVDPARQGLDGQDDFVLRVGLVVRGEKRLGFLQRRLAPAWIRDLHNLAPPGAGLSHVHFFNVGAPGAVVGRERAHPLSDLLRETVTTTTRADGTFDLAATLAMPVETLGIWLSMDGDDTGSSFTLHVSSIVLAVR